MLALEVLVIERASVDGFSARTVVLGEVASLHSFQCHQQPAVEGHKPCCKRA